MAELLSWQLLDECWVSRAMPELLVLAASTEPNNPTVHALWIGPQLRRAIEQRQQPPRPQ